MNSALTTFLFSSSILSASAMTSLHSESRFVGRQINLPPPAEGDNFQLPVELEALIASVSAENDESRQSKNSNVRYYASYSDDTMCASKSTSSFESWEESFESLGDCCEMAFSWDMDACLGN